MSKTGKCMHTLEELISIVGVWYDTLKDIAEELEEHDEGFEKIDELVKTLPHFAQGVDEANTYFAEMCEALEG